MGSRLLSPFRIEIMGLIMKNSQNLSNRQYEEAILKHNLSHCALKSGETEVALIHLSEGINQLASQKIKDAETASLFVSLSLEYSNLCFVLGRNFIELLKFLDIAINV